MVASVLVFESTARILVCARIIRRMSGAGHRQSAENGRITPNRAGVSMRKVFGHANICDVPSGL